jgi:hypothetical protein
MECTPFRFRRWLVERWAALKAMAARCVIAPSKMLAADTSAIGRRLPIRNRAALRIVTLGVRYLVTNTDVLIGVQRLT